MPERVSVQTLEVLYPFISRNPVQIPHQYAFTHRLISDYEHQYPKLGWRDSGQAVKYTYSLNMTPEDYRGKKVLDAGSGLGRFKRALKSMGVEADVTNFDDGETYGRGEDYVVDVQGKVEHMPFADNTFDVSVVSWVFPNQFLDETVDTNFMAEQLRELVRVTKKGGGIIRYTPVRMFQVLQGPEQQAVYDEATIKAFAELEKLHRENPGMKTRITRLIDDQDNGQDQFEDILEITL